MKNRIFCVVASVLVAATAFGARVKGDSIGNAKSLSASQTARLVNEWDSDEKENMDDGICYYTVTLSRGQAYTIWITGGSAPSIDLDVYTNPNYYEDREDEPGALFDVIDIDDGATKVAYLYADDWDEDDPATGRFVVELYGDIGASTTLRFTKGIQSFTRTGMEESPKGLSFSNSWKSFTSSAIEGEYYLRASLKAGRKYRVRTLLGTASNPIALGIDPDEADENGNETVVIDNAFTNVVGNDAFVVMPPKSATYTFVVSTSGNSQKFNLKYTAVPTRSISAHPSIPLMVENGYEAHFRPGRLANTQNYYDAIIDEHLCRIYMAKGERWVFETVGASTNIEMVAYDSAGKIIGTNESQGDNAFDTRIVVTASAAGMYYVGVCDPSLGVYDEPASDVVTLTARRASELPYPDAWDPDDDVAGGASLITPWPATTNDTAVGATTQEGAPTADAVSIGAVHGPHSLGANDHYDLFAIPCRAGCTYALRASFADANDVTDLTLATKVFTLSGTKEVSVSRTGSISPVVYAEDATLGDLKFKAAVSGMHYVRVWVNEGKGLDFPNYNVHAIVMNGESKFGLLKAELAGADGTWSIGTEKVTYPAGATVAVVPASVTVKFTAPSGFTATPASTTENVPAWTPGDDPVTVYSTCGDIYDSKYVMTYTTKKVKDKKTGKTTTQKVPKTYSPDNGDDTPAGAFAITPAATAAALNRTLWTEDVADHFVFTAAKGAYYSFAISGEVDARLVVSNATSGVVADVVSADGQEVDKRLLPEGKTYLIVTHDGLADGSYTLTYQKAASGLVKFTAASYNVKEGSEYATLTVARTEGTEGALRVRYATQAGTALPGTNYYPVIDGEVSWAAGDKANKTIKIRMIPDLYGKWASSNLTFSVRLYPVDEYDLADNEYLARLNDAPVATVVRVEATAKLPGTISLSAYGDGDDDDPLVANVKKPVVEGVAGDGHFTLTFTRTGGSDGEVAVKVATSTAKGDTAKAGVDYEAVSETLVWEDGDAEPKTMDIELLETGGYTLSKKFTVTMSVVKTGTTPTLSAKTATVMVKNAVVEQTAAAYAKTLPASSGVAMATTGTWFIDNNGNLRSSNAAGTATFTLTGPGIFVCEPSLQIDTGIGDGSADFTCQFNKEAPIDCAADDFSGRIVRLVGAGKTTVKFSLSNVKEGAFASLDPQEDGKPYLWVPFSRIAATDPMNDAVVLPTNRVSLAWSMPEELVDEDGLYCRVRFGSAAKPTGIVTNDLLGACSAAFDADLEAGKTYYWALDYAYTSETNLTAEQIAALDYKAGPATWKLSVIKDGAPVTEVLDGVDSTGTSMAELIAAGEPVELLQGVRPDLRLDGTGTGDNALDATNFRLVGGTLPKGLSIDASTGSLKGVPTTPGEYVALLQSYNDNVTEKKVKGKKVKTHSYTYGTTMAVKFNVVAAGTSLGSFRGSLIEDGGVFNNDARRLGALTLSVTSAGKLAAKVTIAGSTYTFSATGYSEVLDYDEIADGVTRHLRADLVNTTKIKKVSYKNYLTVYLGDGSITNTVALAEKPGTAELTMNVPNAKKTAVTSDVRYVCDLYRNNGGTEAGLESIADFTGYYTAALAPEAVTPADGVPVGNGYLMLTVSANNSVKMTGVLADGTSISGSSFGQLVGDDLGDPRSCVLTIPVYAGKAGYALAGIVEVTLPESDDASGLPAIRPASKLLWVKNASATTSRDGLGFAISQAPTGGWYDKVVNLQTYYLNREFAVQTVETGDELPVEALASGYAFAGGSTPQDLSMWFTGNAMSVSGRKLVKDATLGLYDFVDGMTGASINPWSVTLKFTRATGLVTGTFSAWEWKFRTVDGYTYPTAQKEIKKLTHKGVLLFSRDSSSDSPLAANALTAGFFLMPATNSTKAKTIKAAWKASLPFNITTESDSERAWEEKEFTGEGE